MKWPNWVRIAWWAALSIGLTGFLVLRLPHLIAGENTTFDVAALLLLAGLLLAPVFSEVTLWGVTLKQQIDSTKVEIKADVERMRADILSTVQMSNAVSQSVTLAGPPPDNSLPALREQIHEAVRTALREARTEPTPPPVAVPSETEELFRLRYLIEREIRRIASGRQLEKSAASFEGHPSASGLVRGLQRAELLHPKLAEGVRDLYVICSQAIHGQPVSRAQVDFVRATAPELTQALAQIA